MYNHHDSSLLVLSRNVSLSNAHVKLFLYCTSSLLYTPTHISMSSSIEPQPILPAVLPTQTSNPCSSLGCCLLYKFTNEYDISESSFASHTHTHHHHRSNSGVSLSGVLVPILLVPLISSFPTLNPLPVKNFLYHINFATLLSRLSRLVLM